MLRRSASTVALLVSIRIRPDRLTEFINIIEADALGSRQEPGCLRFDVLRDPHDDHRFHLYEMYRDEAAASLHRVVGIPLLEDTPLAVSKVRKMEATCWRNL